jgi:ethanolamine ammonia-lyase large subunit
MSFSHSIGGMVWRFDSLRELMAKASPARSGDFLAEIAASSDAERAAAQMAWPTCRSSASSMRR